MRRSLLFIPLFFWMVSLYAVDSIAVCVRSFPSLIELVSGEYASPAYLQQGQLTYAWVQACTTSYYTPAQSRVMQLLAEGNASAAQELLKTVDSTTMAASPTFRILAAACNYLVTYTNGDLRNPDEVPLFEGFNGGFASTVERALRWDTLSVLPASELNKAIVTWMEVIYRGDERMPGIYFEMLGDLMLRYGNVQVSRWVAAMAYLRAAEEYRNDTITERYRTKAIYALESHQKNPTTFNRYRFNQLVSVFHDAWLRGVALREEIAALSGAWGPEEQKQIDSLHLRYGSRIGNNVRPGSYDDMPINPDNPLVQLIQKDLEIYGDIAENDPNRETMNRDLDVNKIKSVPSHNVFAIVMILIVIGSALLFYVKIRNRQREMDREDKAADSGDSKLS